MTHLRLLRSSNRCMAGRLRRRRRSRACCSCCCSAKGLITSQLSLLLQLVVAKLAAWLTAARGAVMGAGTATDSSVRARRRMLLLLAHLPLALRLLKNQTIVITGCL